MASGLFGDAAGSRKPVITARCASAEVTRPRPTTAPMTMDPMPAQLNRP